MESNKTMTIDKLAEISQKEFLAIRSEMANKDDVGTILRAIEGVDLHLSAYASRWTEDFAKLHDWVKQLDGRVKFLEKSGKQ